MVRRQPSGIGYGCFQNGSSWHPTYCHGRRTRGRLGHYQGLALSQSVSKLAIINIDAHYDLRPLDDGRGSSGTSFLQIANERRSLNQPFSYSCVGLQRFGNSQSLWIEHKNWALLPFMQIKMDSAVTTINQLSMPMTPSILPFVWMSLLLPIVRV